MRKVQVHALAESDLVGIWRYSFEQWGDEQADKYLGGLDSAIRSLADNPERGIGRENVCKGYRVLFVGSHAVYYTVTPTAINVIRVLQPPTVTPSDARAFGCSYAISLLNRWTESDAVTLSTIARRPRRLSANRGSARKRSKTATIATVVEWSGSRSTTMPLYFSGG
jgi:toxin ParE1/3/4